jgi:Ca-activated chloride channel homolog
MGLTWPLALVALLAVPLVAGLYLLVARRRTRYATTYTNMDVLASVAATARPWRGLVPAGLFLAALAALGLALARPHMALSVPEDRATVVLVVDTSGSMRADDVNPTRLDAARAAINVSLDKLPKRVRVGLVSFDSEVSVLAAPTPDRNQVREATGFLSPGGGTALGDGLTAAVDLAVGAVRGGSGKRPPAAVLLLSDGKQTQGNTRPTTAAQHARSAGIAVYTVALGTPNGVVTFGPPGFEQSRPVPPDPATLQLIARTTGGQAFNVTNADNLKQVYRKLGSMIGQHKEQREVTPALAGIGAIFLLAALGLGALWSPRLP